MQSHLSHILNFMVLALRLLCHRPIWWGYNALMVVICLSIRLSVCPCLTLSQKMEGHTMLRIVRKESHDTGDP